jgi:hypothetical protein
MKLEKSLCLLKELNGKPIVSKGVGLPSFDTYVIQYDDIFFVLMGIRANTFEFFTFVSDCIPWAAKWEPINDVLELDSYLKAHPDHNDITVALHKKQLLIDNGIIQEEV